MEDSEDAACSDDEEYVDEEDDECFESEPVHAAVVPFQALDAAACLELAQTEVVSVSELLCCTSDVAAQLLRHFSWDREKLMDGAHMAHIYGGPRARVGGVRGGRGGERPYDLGIRVNTGMGVCVGAATGPRGRDRESG